MCNFTNALILLVINKTSVEIVLWIVYNNNNEIWIPYLFSMTFGIFLKSALFIP